MNENIILFLITGIPCAALQAVNSNSTGQDGKYKAVQQITCNTGFIIYSNKSNAYITECTESGLWSHVEDCHSENILLCCLEKHLITYLPSYYIIMTQFQYILIIFIAQRFVTN